MWQGQEGLRDRECVVVSVSLKKEQCSRLFFFFFLSFFFLLLWLSFCRFSLQVHLFLPLDLVLWVWDISLSL